MRKHLPAMSFLRAGCAVRAIQSKFPAPPDFVADLLCFSWDFRTVAGSAKIAAFLAWSDQESGGQSRFARAGLHDFKRDTTSTIGAPALFTLPNNSAVHG